MATPLFRSPINGRYAYLFFSLKRGQMSGPGCRDLDQERRDAVLCSLLTLDSLLRSKPLNQVPWAEILQCISVLLAYSSAQLQAVINILAPPEHRYGSPDIIEDDLPYSRGKNSPYAPSSMPYRPDEVEPYTENRAENVSAGISAFKNGHGLWMLALAAEVIEKEDMALSRTYQECSLSEYVSMPISKPSGP
ncbi:hypothetical protein CDEST_01987 [Colletotrichum destructivum]|uniref:Uncharacterized protein n=1 Tax=Colletotrichum destructivum TaxID=34406 RepID=A0AAX4I1W7_9PEZI|nr:hypothetical protein CDEST_01987 [Colletotrichum destructivum]